MKKDSKFYLTIFFSTLYLSAFTFGGGYVIVPLLRERFVTDLKWIKEEEMIDLIAIAQSSPGALVINSSIIIGYKLGGILGALVSLAGTVLPPLLIITIVSYFYIAFKDNMIVRGVINGMLAGVAAVILGVVIKMIKDLLKSRDKVTLLLMLSCFVVVACIKVAMVIPLYAILGIICSYLKAKNQGGEEK